MNQSPTPSESYGSLIVRVSTARGAIPLAGAAVSIRGEDAEDSGILYSLVTDSDGRTERINLPTPNRSISEAPGNVRPYAVYSVDVFLDGYLPLSFQNVPVFPSILSVQPAVMIPDTRSGSTHSPVTVIEGESMEK